MCVCVCVCVCVRLIIILYCIELHLIQHWSYVESNQRLGNKVPRLFHFETV